MFFKISVSLEIRSKIVLLRALVTGRAQEDVMGTLRTLCRRNVFAFGGILTISSVNATGHLKTQYSLICQMTE